MKQLLYIIIALMLLPAAVDAQSLTGSRIHVDKSSLVVAKDGKFMVEMNIVIPADVKITSNRMATITPVLRSKDDKKSNVFKPIYIYGRRREIVNERNNDLPTDAYKSFRRKNKTEQSVSYVANIPFMTWMMMSNLELHVDLCGCGNKLEGDREMMSVAELNVERYTMKSPLVAFVTPKVEAIKTRSEEGSAFLDFPVNKVTIFPDYRSNPSELAKIRKTIDLVKNDKNTKITEITITGYASPEGSYESNGRLAQGRSEALKKYVLSRYDMNDNLISVSSVAEDWVGLRQYVENSDLSQKDRILFIIDKMDADYDAKERGIKAIDGGRPYATLLRDCYPALRHSDYVVKYIVRGFNVEESKEIIRTRPQQLSLEEMFRLAESYNKGGDEFNAVFDVAVRMFPIDPIANVNAAAIELQRGDLKRAAAYLERADPKISATLINKGVLAQLQGDLNKAEDYYKAALAIGNSPEAAANIEEVVKKRENNALFGDKQE